MLVAWRVGDSGYVVVNFDTGCFGWVIRWRCFSNWLDWVLVVRLLRVVCDLIDLLVSLWLLWTDLCVLDYALWVCLCKCTGSYFVVCESWGRLVGVLVLLPSEGCFCLILVAVGVCLDG